MTSPTTTISTNSASIKALPRKTPKNSARHHGRVSVEGEVKTKRKFTHGRDPQARSARRAHLPSSLRGRLVDCRPVDRFFSKRHRQSRPAHGQSKIRRVRIALRSQPNARSQIRRHRFSLRRRPPPRRSHEPAHAALRRDVRRPAAESGRRARPHGHPVEVRFQEHQVHRQN